MADPLSITASIIAVLQLSGSVVNMFATAYQASEDRNRIMTEITSVIGILFHLKDLAERAPHGGHWPQVMKSLAVPQGPIAQFQSTLEELASRLQPQVGRRMLGKYIKWPFQKEQVKDILAILERQKSTFLVALAFDQM
jgi:hypothetical protein